MTSARVKFLLPAFLFIVVLLLFWSSPITKPTPNSLVADDVLWVNTKPHTNDSNNVTLKSACIDAAPKSFEGFDNTLGHPDGCFIVPNYVHFLRFGQPEFSFVEAVCLLAALKNQRPHKLYIHTDVPEFTGRYWNILLKQPGLKEVLQIEQVELPTDIFGQPLNMGWQKFHGGDVTRLRILRRYGGVFLDNDSYMVRGVNDLRRYEMSLGWMENESLANQAIIANPRARFLRLWLETYRDGYNQSLWYWNAGVKPTDEVLKKKPYLIHREKLLLANHYIINELFEQIWPQWRTHYVIHLLANHQYLLKNISETATYPVQWDEDVIHKYPITFRDMVYDVWPYDPRKIPST